MRTLLQMICVLIALCAGFFIWFTFYSTTPLTKISNIEDLDFSIQHPSTSSLSPGTYLLYQVTRILDRGTDEWANDDTQETTIFAHQIGVEQSQVVKQIISGEESTGGIVTTLFGNDLLVHRYSPTSDAIVNLLGEVKEIPENWGLMRSKNGRFEVGFVSGYDLTVVDGVQQDSYPLTVTDRTTGVKKTFMISAKDQGIDFGVIQPTAITNDGKFVYFDHSCFCDGFLPARLWKLFVENGEMIEIKSLLKLQEKETGGFGHSTVFNPELGKLIFVRTQIIDDPSNLAFGVSPGPPSTVFMIDTNTDTATEFFSDKDVVITALAMSPDGLEWIFHKTYDTTLWKGSVKTQESVTPEILTEGNFLEWLDRGMVIRRFGDEMIYLDLSTKEITPLIRSIGSYLDADYQSALYIGSVIID